MKVNKLPTLGSWIDEWLTRLLNKNLKDMVLICRMFSEIITWQLVFRVSISSCTR